MAKTDNLAFPIHDAFNERQLLLERLEIPTSIANNLNSKFELRDYQKQAFKRLHFYFNEDEEGRVFPEKVNHLGFNMATGSGKTLIMAGIILYLYEKGYRNFLFFSTGRQIIEKTRDNFLNSNSSKYLFNEDIIINNQHIEINECENFDYASDEDINICFTTIHGLHSKLKNDAENQITLEDFKRHKTVIIGDEAHHFSVLSKRREEQLELWDSKNWEATIEKILATHNENMFFELTATFEFDRHAIYEKYKNKIIYKYDIKEFRNDKFSKEILIMQSDIEKRELILQAILFNQYRQEIALEHGLEIKPVILFKSNKSIKESRENQELLNDIIDNLAYDDIEALRENIMKSDDNNQTLKKSFQYFSNHNDRFSYLIQIIKRNFAKNKQLNVNESEAQNELDNVRSQEVLLNSLEESNNQIRAIFAVQKLNEGWDVLNLFDIVKLYNEEIHSTTPRGTTKKQTISEAQLIGRGARYYPFTTKNEEGELITYSEIDRYKRKFDDNNEHELRILEELYYHSQYNSAFIDSLNKELIEQGWIDNPDLYEEKEIKIKPHIKVSDFWRKEIVFRNKKVKKRYDKYNLWDRLPYGPAGRNFEYRIPTGVILTDILLSERDQDRYADIDTRATDLNLKDIPDMLKKNAMLYNNFYNFDNLKQKFPKIKTSDDFINSYLNHLKIRYFGDKKDLICIKMYEETLLSKIEKITDIEYVKIMLNIKKQVFRSLVYLLNDIERKLSRYTTLYQGTPYFKEKDHLYVQFKEKTLRIKKDDGARIENNSGLIGNKDWFVYDALHGTTEEISFVKLFNDSIYDYLQEKGYKNIYLVRNEEDYKIHDFDTGEGFCPDFLLFCTDKDNKDRRYQVLIEPKGKFLEAKDDWKNSMLQVILEKYREDDKLTSVEFGKTIYHIIGMPFYNSSEPNKFEENFSKTL